MRAPINLSDFAKVKANYLAKTKDFDSINLQKLEKNNRKWRQPIEGKSLSSVKQQRSISSNLSFQHQEVGRKVERDDEFGLSTLMDISVSSIKNQRREKTKVKDPKEWEIKEQIREMREKLERVLQKQLTTNQYKDKDWKMQSNEGIDEEESRYLLQLKRQIQREKVKKFELCMKKIVTRRFVRQLNIFYELVKLKKRKQEKELGFLYQLWKQFVEKEGQKRRTMLLVKEKVLQKRKNKENSIDILVHTPQSA